MKGFQEEGTVRTKTLRRAQGTVRSPGLTERVQHALKKQKQKKDEKKKFNLIQRLKDTKCHEFEGQSLESMKL